MKGRVIMERTMQAQMVQLSGELGRGIMREIKSSPITPYSVLHQRSKMMEAEILKKRADEKQKTCIG